jgi:transcriptional accessory protein Tex/SPT6
MNQIENVNVTYIILFSQISDIFCYIPLFQVMAIHRGENLKILNITFNVPDSVKHSYMNYCQRQWIATNMCKDAEKLIIVSIEDGFKRMVEPLHIRRIK